MSPTPFDLLFNPRGIVVAGASTHPGKFGFVALHNVLAGGFDGPVFATNPEQPTILGLDTLASVDQVPAGTADLVLVCTPPQTCPDILRSAASRGIGAAFIASGGFREAGAEGARAEKELIDLAHSLGLVVAGPNGQGLISTPAKLAAQIVAPVPPPGPIAVASQSGNLVSAFMNHAAHSGVGISRAVSAGNAAMVGVVDYLGWFAGDPHTKAMAAYVEGSGRRPAIRDRHPGGVRREAGGFWSKEGPLLGVRRPRPAIPGRWPPTTGYSTAWCARAAQCGPPTIEEAFDAVAAFATQPLPAGPRTVVLSSAGGWGFIAADAVSKSNLELIPLPADLEAAIDRLVAAPLEPPQPHRPGRGREPRHHPGGDPPGGRAS